MLFNEFVSFSIARRAIRSALASENLTLLDRNKANYITNVTVCRPADKQIYRYCYN